MGAELLSVMLLFCVVLSFVAGCNGTEIDDADRCVEGSCFLLLLEDSVNVFKTCGAL